MQRSLRVALELRLLLSQGFQQISAHRVFGITQLKIDPAFTSGSQLPTARITFQQQITSNVTFTYTSALDDPNSTIIRAEWSFNPQYSAVATRDQNGLVSVLLFYKKQFR